MEVEGEMEEHEVMVPGMEPEDDDLARGGSQHLGETEEQLGGVQVEAHRYQEEVDDDDDDPEEGEEVEVDRLLDDDDDQEEVEVDRLLDDDDDQEAGVDGVNVHDGQDNEGLDGRDGDDDQQHWP